MFAPSAAIRVIPFGDVIAVPTANATPVFERDVRTFFAIRFQHAADETERIGNAALLKRRLNRDGGIARTQAFILDMRMRHGGIAGRRIGIERDHVEAIATRLVLKPRPVKLD